MRLWPRVSRRIFPEISGPDTLGTVSAMMQRGYGPQEGGGSAAARLMLLVRRHYYSSKMIANQHKKAEFIREGDELNQQLRSIEKDKNNLLFHKKSDFRMEYNTLEELEHQLTKNRKAEKANIQQKLGRISNNVKELQRQLKRVKPTPESVDGLRQRMEEAERAMNAFKEEQQQKYEALMTEEKTATDEIHSLERKIESWALPSIPENKRQSRENNMVQKMKKPEEGLSIATIVQQAAAQKQKADNERKKRLKELDLWKRQKAKEYRMKEAGQQKEKEEKQKKKEKDRSSKFRGGWKA